MDAFELLQRQGSDIPFVLVTGSLGDVRAVECIKQGVADYVLKDAVARLPEAICRALQEKRQVRLRRQAEEDLARKIDELARCNAELEQFAYVASHDLQEPQRMVASYTQLAWRTLSRPTGRRCQQIHWLRMDGAQRTQTMIHDLRPCSRMGKSARTTQLLQQQPFPVPVRLFRSN